MRKIGCPVPKKVPKTPFLALLFENFVQKYI